MLHVKLAIGAMICVGVIGARPGRADDTDGSVLVGSCFTCHGPGGESPGPIPSINGHSAEETAAMLRGFASGTIDATIMDRVARGYTDEEIDRIATYLATAGTGR